ncbi:DUF1772 domain-containing protein [Actinoplanes sp. NPDC051411]|uniref:DUF1772 domain-containing protein n=1 Tax=Actinoplanes sp. NPDC051411 TaxID=3155522 RepID=UPI00341835F4
MTGWQNTLGALATVVNGLAAGIMLATVIGVVPMMIAQPYTGYVRMVQFMRPRFDPIMPIANGTALILDVVLAATGAIRPLHLAAAVLLAGVILISVSRNVPVNRYVMSLDPERRPDDWARLDPRPRWQFWNTTRTLLAATAFLLNTVAVLW